MDIVNQEWFQQLFLLPGGQIPWWAEVVRSIIRLLIGVVGALGSVPILVWLERRMLGFFQGRLGPNRVGPQGILQPFADALKLMIKEDIIPTNVDRTLYVMAPGVALAPIVMSVTVLPWNASREWGAVAPGLDIGILFLLAIASIEVYGVILAGWSSNNKYSLLGGLRASSQVISYELGMGLSIIAVLLMTGTLGTQDIVTGYVPNNLYPYDNGTVLTNGQGHITITEVPNSNGQVLWEHAWFSGFWDWNFLKLFPFGLIAAVIYLISMIAETNRAPFDLPEAETELVAGFHTEYTSFKFAMFFMGEYANMLIVSAIAVTLFFGGWLAPIGVLSQVPASMAINFPSWLVVFLNYWIISPLWFVLKLYVLIAFFILVRATFPRLRYDMLMKFGWKGLLPIALVNLILIAVSIGVQEVSKASGVSGFLAWWAGQLVAWFLLAVVLLIAFFAYRTGWYNARRDAASTELVPVVRDSVIVPMSARPAPEKQ
ncbi:MAG: NADH-quinone oxidoreductase subunit NuoH [Armatimonadaceae bacterium]